MRSNAQVASLVFDCSILGNRSTPLAWTWTSNTMSPDISFFCSYCPKMKMTHEYRNFLSNSGMNARHPLWYVPTYEWGSDAKPVVVTEKNNRGVRWLYRVRSGSKNGMPLSVLNLSLVSHEGSFLSKAKNQKTRRNELKKDLDYKRIKYVFFFLMWLQFVIVSANRWRSAFKKWSSVSAKQIFKIN